MNASYLGDSYDVVKRFFCSMARAQGYSIYVDPLFTGKWTPLQRSDFHRFLEASAIEGDPTKGPAALLVDPDTGVRATPGPSHTTFQTIADRCKQFDLVLVFDQAFSRNQPAREAMSAKLQALRALGVRGLYYDSHARFLMCGKRSSLVMRFQKSLLRSGLPATRFVGIPAGPA